MQRYIADPDVHINHHDPLNSVSADSGDIEMGRAKPSSSSSLPTGVPSGAVTGIALARPKQIQRGNSKSGIINCVTTGKEVIRTQSAFVRAEHSQEPGDKRERRTSLLLTANNTRNNGTTIPKRKHRKRSDSNFSGSHQNPHHELLTSHSSKHGMYMVSSRNIGSVDSRSIRAVDSERLSSVEQYCLQKVAPQTRTSCLLKWLGCGGSTVLSIYDTSQTQSKPCVCFGFEFNLVYVLFFICALGHWHAPSNIALILTIFNFSIATISVVNFFHWLFRQTFTTVILTLSACFMAVAFLFATGIFIYGIRNPECIFGVDFAKTQYFTDAFILSWTTLSTCGYGSIQPIIPKKVGHCLPITITMALEGFLGVLIGSLCSAIFFAKVSRIQSFAQVDFSEVVCIRFGNGLNDETPIGNSGKPAVATTFQAVLEDESSSAINLDFDMKLPCPILEFRVVNRMHNIPGGEIVDARINVVASIDSANFNSSTSTPMNGVASAKAIKRRPGKKRRVSRRTDIPPLYSLSERVASMRTMTLPRLDDSCGVIDETQQSSIPRTVLTKLDCESLDHPFFKRVFTIRHRLDEYSPLLKIGSKLMIQANDGYWPHELNDAKSVRESIHFDEIIIRLTGLSNADANTVFSHTVYDFNDLRVGYQFSHMLYRSVADGSLRANASLLSSVIEQEGGGGELLNSDVNVRKIRDVSMRL